MIKIAPCPARPALAGSPAATVPGVPGAPHQEFPPRGLAQVPPPTPRPRPQGTALSLQVPRRVEGPRAEELLKPSGMGAGGAASHSLAWASLPLLGPPAGALCEDTLCCRGKTRPAAGAPLALPRHLLAPLSLSLPGSAEREEGPAQQRGTRVGGGARRKQASEPEQGLGRRIRRSLQTHL